MVVIWRNCVKCGTMVHIARGMECDRCVNIRLELERADRERFVRDRGGRARVVGELNRDSN